MSPFCLPPLPRFSASPVRAVRLGRALQRARRQPRDDRHRSGITKLGMLNDILPACQSRHGVEIRSTPFQAGSQNQWSWPQ